MRRVEPDRHRRQRLRVGRLGRKSDEQQGAGGSCRRPSCRSTPATAPATTDHHRAIGRRRARPRTAVAWIVGADHEEIADDMDLVPRHDRHDHLRHRTWRGRRADGEERDEQQHCGEAGPRAPGRPAGGRPGALTGDDAPSSPRSMLIRHHQHDLRTVEAAAGDRTEPHGAAAGGTVDDAEHLGLGPAGGAGPRPRAGDPRPAGCTTSGWAPPALQAGERPGAEVPEAACRCRRRR